ncbi:MAG TPA: hypothetical protein VL172_06215 [Kofleriaceae bacterium]|nr:hypothetical protein [Kofleriaceae bacterium]
MIIAALVIGLVTAYYFGVRPGSYAAIAAAGLFFLAMVWPSRAMTIYVLMGIGFCGVLLVGPRRQAPGAKRDVMRLVGRALAWLRGKRR